MEKHFDLYCFTSNILHLVESGDDSDDDRSTIYGTDDEDDKDESTFIETKEELEDIRLSRHKLEQYVLRSMYYCIKNICKSYIIFLAFRLNLFLI